jgi:hypothetical protein
MPLVAGGSPMRRHCGGVSCRDATPGLRPPSRSSRTWGTSRYGPASGTRLRGASTRNDWPADDHYPGRTSTGRPRRGRRPHRRGHVAQPRRDPALRLLARGHLRLPGAGAVPALHRHRRRRADPQLHAGRRHRAELRHVRGSGDAGRLRDERGAGRGDVQLLRPDEVGEALRRNGRDPVAAVRDRAGELGWALLRGRCTRPPSSS